MPYTPSLQPSALNPQLSTLYPVPSALNPQPSTLNPQPSTPNPKPYTLHTKPQFSPISTTRPNPYTLNPNPQALHLKCRGEADALEREQVARTSAGLLAAFGIASPRKPDEARVARNIFTFHERNPPSKGSPSRVPLARLGNQ